MFLVHDVYLIYQLYSIN